MILLDSEIYYEDVRRVANSLPGIERLFGKRVLVAGASGMIGSSIVDIIRFLNRERQANISVYALGRHKEKLEKCFGLVDDDIIFLIDDLCKDAPFPDGIDYLIDCAGESYPDAFKNRPVEVIRTAIMGIDKCLSYAVNNIECRVVYISSGEVYARIIDTLETRNSYPHCKRASESLCISYKSEYDVDVVIARPCHIYGATMTTGDDSVAAQCIRAALLGKDIILYSDGLQKRPYLYALDCAGGIVTAMLWGKSGSAYDVAASKSISIYELAEACARTIGSNVIKRKASDEEKGKISPIDNQEMNSLPLTELGWRETIQLNEGIRHSINILQDIETRRVKR